MIYLAVPYSEKDEAKRLGAKWDPDSKKWYAPNERVFEKLKRWEINNQPCVLDGEDRNFGGDLLFVDLIPLSCWFTNARSCIHPSDWDRVRFHIYERVGNKCECCSSYGNLEAHERWNYDEEKNTQKLVRLVALCHDCHQATHIGMAGINGKRLEAEEHLKKIRKFTGKELEEHITEAFKLWRERNKIEWNLDLSLLELNGIKVNKIKLEHRSVICSEKLHG